MDKICRYLDRELEEMENKVANGGKLSRTEIEDGKNIAKFKMALLTNEAMERDGYSNTYPHYPVAYGRKRDAMGRYSRADAKEDFIIEVEELMEKAPDEHTRKKVERFLSEMR